MPTYDYYCSQNKQTVNVQHGMKEKLANWGELCERTSQGSFGKLLDVLERSKEAGFECIYIICFF